MLFLISSSGFSIILGKKMPSFETLGMDFEASCDMNEYSNVGGLKQCFNSDIWNEADSRFWQVKEETTMHQGYAIGLILTFYNMCKKVHNIWIVQNIWKV